VLRAPVRRFLVALAACAAPAVLAVVVACSSSSASPGGPGADAATDATGTGGDAAADAGATGDAADELTVGSSCGSPPYVTLGIVAVGLTIDNPDGAPLPGAQFTSPLCPNVVHYADDAGVIEGQISANTPFYGRLASQGYISELAPEELVDADSTGHRIPMIPSFIEGVLFPGFDAGGSAAIIVSLQTTTDDAGACSALDGVTLSVPGHPEANVAYFANGTIPAPVPDAGATTTRGLAGITGLAAGQLVTLAGTKAGCQVLFQYDTQTGRTPLETGYVSLMPAYLTP
jgi:hypothetical protein